MPELLIAIIVICIGLLSLATGGMGVMRQMQWGNQSALASIVAQSRMERLRSQKCSSLLSGSATTSGLNEQWTVGQFNSKTDTVHVTVAYTPRSDKTESLTLTAVIPCA